LDSHFIDQFDLPSDIWKQEIRELPYEIECQASDRRDAQAHDAALLLCGDRSLSLIFS
jgi:hypothetical protein